MIEWNKMEIIDTEIPGVRILVPKVYGDRRGYFVETYNAERYRAAGITTEFLQDNESLSMKGVVRGLHWQAGAYAQAKLVRVVRGAIWDVVVDIRKGSQTFGRHFAVTLSAENGRQLFIPRGFAHGFIVLEDETLLSYKCDNLYCPSSERGLLFSDPALGIKWPDVGVPLTLSDKDRAHPPLAGIEAWEAS